MNKNVIGVKDMNGIILTPDKVVGITKLENFDEALVDKSYGYRLAKNEEFEVVGKMSKVCCSYRKDNVKKVRELMKVFGDTSPMIYVPEKEPAPMILRGETVVGFVAPVVEDG